MYTDPVSKRTGRQGPEDMNETAFRIVQQITGQAPKEPEPESDLSAKRAEAGRKGGLKGGQSRSQKLSSQERSEIARKAAAARWKKSG
jgi:hypothetical protein